MPVPVTCGCGKKMKVPDELVGRRVKCPGCGKGVAVPADDEDADDRDEPAPRAARVQREQPARRPAVRDDDEDDDDRPRKRRRDDDEDEDERPRRRSRDEDDVRSRKRGRKKAAGGSKLPLVLALVFGGLLLVGGGGAGLVWFLLRGGPAVNEAIFLTPDAQGIVSVRAAEMTKFAAFQQALQAGGGPNPLNEMASEIGLSAGDIERVTVVMPDFSQQNAFWVVVNTSKPIDQKVTLQKMKNVRKVSHEGFTFHLGETAAVPAGRPGIGGPMGGAGAGATNTQSVYFANPKAAVFAKDEAGMKRAITAAARKNPTGPLADAARQAATGSRHLFAAFHIPPAAQQQLKQQAAAVPQAKALLEMTSATIAMDYGDTITVDATLKFPKEADAQAAKKTVDGLIGLARLGLMGKDAQIDAALEQIFTSLSSEAKGSDLAVKLSVKAQVVEAAAQRAAQPGK